MVPTLFVYIELLTNPKMKAIKVLRRKHSHLLQMLRRVALGSLEKVVIK